MDIAGNMDHRIDMDPDSSSDNEILNQVVRVLHGRARPPAVIVPWVIDPGLWLNMVRVNFLDLEIEIMNYFILKYKRYCPK